uniref:Uncharacterized protein n=1 Tax=Caenorhabditis japonica TaxID=281687 RepID=A0A8R1HNJ0_CAEJA
MSKNGKIVPPTVEISTIIDVATPSSSANGDSENRVVTENSNFIGQLQHPPLRRRPVSAMASLPWVAYQAPRDDATDDEDAAVESTLFLSTSPSGFPSQGGSVSSLALSPPGLSPLNFNDGSPFSLSSTPSSTGSLVRSQNRFTFDHIPFIGSSANSTPATASTGLSGLSPGAVASVEHEKSAFEVVSSTSNAEEILQRVRLGTSGSSSTNNTRNSQSETGDVSSGSQADATVPGHSKTKRSPDSKSKQSEKTLQ